MFATLDNFFGPDALIIFLFTMLLFAARKLPKMTRGEDKEENARPTSWHWFDVVAITSLVFAGMLWLILLTP